MQKKRTAVGCIIIIIFSILVLFLVNQVYQKNLFPPKEILDDKVLLIYPRITMVAYSKDSFYQYFKGNCNESCLTQPLTKDDYNRYNLGLNGFDFFNHNYNSITDIELDKNPDILKNYHTVILFHNEYVTQNIFNAVTNHPNVIYLYPNSLYGMVTIDYDLQTVKLIQGHDYNGMKNGFDWKYDNTNKEKDCIEWNFETIPNGIMLDCYPENIIKTDTKLQNYVKNYIKSHKTL